MTNESSDEMRKQAEKKRKDLEIFQKNKSHTPPKKKKEEEED